MDVTLNINKHGKFTGATEGVHGPTVNEEMYL